MKDAEEKKNYKETLNLPKTAFEMQAKLVQNEPKRLERWREMRLYEKVQTARAGAEKWVLHDGPPFANGDIHIGHVINHVLKDVVIRFRTLQGYQSPFVPGWDCHGLPIEHKIQQEIGPKIREMPPEEVRRRCHEYAAKFIDIQREQLIRLGVLGEWDRPYVTMSPEYEASQVEVFAKMVEAGLVFKKLRPVPWSVANQTALAEGGIELEYREVEDPSVYVEFPVEAVEHELNAHATHLLVWTTTPWTLPANLAVAVHPEIDYAFVRYARDGVERIGIVATDLVERVFKDRKGIERFEVLQHVSGHMLIEANIEYGHPFIERRGRILPAMYVTTEEGTGLVHTAPGHGMDDYSTGLSAGLPPYSPVMGNGRFDDSVPEWLRGRTVWEANPLVIEKLRENGLLLGVQTVKHSYPHDWRSKTPVIMRAAEQWFIGVDKPYVVPGETGIPRTLRERAREAIVNQVDFFPEWASHRLAGMVETRPDWSISRQRVWGLPIPVFYNPSGEALLTRESVRAVATQFRQHGSDAWYTKSPAELLGPDFVYPPGFRPEELRKEQDTFDVGLDSGTSWHAVLYGNAAMQFPCDLYLEGSDQHRLWFQLSLLASLAATGQPPFRQVLTHGFIVKPDGTKVSKSDKEYVTATKEIDTHGADLLRLWCCSVDYQGDIPTSPKMIQEFGDKYRKIRNTLRYLLSNLYDYEPPTPSPPEFAKDLPGEGRGEGTPSPGTPGEGWGEGFGTGAIPPNSLDAWISHRLDQLIRDVTAAYDAYQLHRAFRLLHDFCAVEISSIYGNAMKDRLYCEAPDSPLRRRCQMVMHRIVIALTKLLSPMLVFTADEAWEHIPHKPGDEANLPSVHLALLPRPLDLEVDDDTLEEWRLLMELRESALLQLDNLKKTAGLNKALDAEVIYRIDDDTLRRRLQEYGPDLEDLVGVGHHAFSEKTEEGRAVEVKVVDRRNNYPACARSWKRRPDVGDDPQHPDLSLRDANAVRSLAKAPG